MLSAQMDGGRQNRKADLAKFVCAHLGLEKLPSGKGIDKGSGIKDYVKQIKAWLEQLYNPHAAKLLRDIPDHDGSATSSKWMMFLRDTIDPWLSRQSGTWAPSSGDALGTALTTGGYTGSMGLQGGKGVQKRKRVAPDDGELEDALEDFSGDELAALMDPAPADEQMDPENAHADTPPGGSSTAASDVVDEARESRFLAAYLPMLNNEEDSSTSSSATTTCPKPSAMPSQCARERSPAGGCSTPSGPTGARCSSAAQRFLRCPKAFGRARCSRKPR